MEAAVSFRAPLQCVKGSPALSAHTSHGASPGIKSAFLPSNMRRSLALLKMGLNSSSRHSFLLQSRRRGGLFLVRASSSGEESSTPIAPFKPESPTGQFLTQLLQSHPHLVPAAVEVELEKLVENRKAEGDQEEPKSSGAELVLYRRIAELKAQERRKALEEIIYTLIVQKFVEAGVSMVPSLSCVLSVEKPWPVQVKELEAVHSLEVLEMIQQHLTLVLGGRVAADYFDQNIYAQISKVRVGQVYAASIIYGYFLRRVFQRYQLEKTMNLLPAGLDNSSTEERTVSHPELVDQPKELSGSMAAAMSVLQGLGSATPIQPSGVKKTKLESYLTSFDVETLQKFATLRSRESLGVLEKHTEALFGRPEIRISPDGSMTVNKDEILKISFAGLKGLVLEAVAFGSFLWDVESYVDSCYSFVTN